jgi:hypothetical protein
VALVKVPFYFINLWLIPDRQSYCTLHYYSPVVGQSDFARLDRLTTLLLRPSVDTGAGDGPKFRTFPSKVTLGLHPTPPSNPGVGTPASPKAVTYPEGLVDTQHLAVPDAHSVVSAQSQLRTCEDARP